MSDAVLVTGGAGYIGSHVVHQLVRAGHAVVVVDDLSGGHGAALPDGVVFERADVTQEGVLESLSARTNARALLHFAARIQVGESVARPDLYYGTNVTGMLRVAQVAASRRIPVVFSSTAAVYGVPRAVPIPVDHPCAPESPYGASKWMGERVLADHARAFGFGYAVLRYFNAAGADVEARLVERHVPETHLIPLAIDAALGAAPLLKLFGADWETRDGTCIRDYVHVLDLADAHVLALDRLLAGGPSLTVNLGGGEGTTVREVLDAVARVVERPVPHEIAPRRPGDVVALVADVSAARDRLGWKPVRSGIEQIVRDAAAVRAQR
jgi:UDP-glucose-4-epimerase GalE